MGLLSRLTPARILFAFLAIPALSAVSATQLPDIPIDSSVEPVETEPVAMPDGLIHLDLVVTNSTGRPVVGLNSSDFAVLDNGRARDIASFAAYQGAIRPDPAVTVTLVLDTLRLSGGAANLESVEYDQVEKFLRQNDGHLGQPVTILELTDNGLWQVGEPSADGNALADAIAHHHRTVRLDAQHTRSAYGLQPSGNPPAWRPESDDPPMVALRALGTIAAAERRKPGRKILIWLGPGWGLASGRNVKADIADKKNREGLFEAAVWFSTLLRLARVSLYSFSFGEDDVTVSDSLPQPRAALSSAREPDAPKDVTAFDLNRKELAVESGGRVFPPAADIVTELNNCLRDRNAFYTLSFNPPPAGHTDEYHEVKVITRAGKLTVRTSPGYYDEPYFSDLPDAAVRRIAVAELGQLLDGARSSSDSDVAKSLEKVQLTERLSLAKLAAWSGQLRGKKSREALEALAGRSAFLDPPADEVLFDAPPDADAQKHILAEAGDYLEQVIPKLPDFFATRTSIDGSETPVFKPSDRSVAFEPLHETRHTQATVLYRNGREVVDAKQRSQKKDPYSLSTYGVFGPILNVVKGALSAPDHVAWLRWEKGATGPLAVFHYSVPQSQSLYRTLACCLPDGDGTLSYIITPAYHGTISIDRASGAILSFTLQADLDSFVPADLSAIAVTYGPVEIGGRTYTMPLQSTSLLRRRSVHEFVEWEESFKDWGPYMSTLNEFEFSNYHNFHADMRILTGFTSVNGDNAPADPGSPQAH